MTWNFFFFYFHCVHPICWALCQLYHISVECFCFMDDVPCFTAFFRMQILCNVGVQMRCWEKKCLRWNSLVCEIHNVMYVQCVPLILKIANRCTFIGNSALF